MATGGRGGPNLLAQISCAVSPCMVKLLSLQHPYALHCDFGLSCQEEKDPVYAM